MLKCSYCGKEYPDDTLSCCIDGTALTAVKEQSVQEPEAWQPEFIDLAEVDGVFSFEEGFSRPNWKIISQAIQQRVSETEDLSAAWSEAARQWVMQLRSDLGGDYRVRESQQFILLTPLDSQTSEELLAFSGETLEHIRSRLKDAAWRPSCGKHVILLFLEDDDYFQYVMYFHRDGIHPRTGGCLIHRDYVHIAVLHTRYGTRRVLTHELAHNCVVHLKLPLWVNEGLAVLFERSTARVPGQFLDGELRDRHLAFWNEENIQDFWAGTSFHKPGDSNELSYSLAAIALTLLLEKEGDWSGFLKQAQMADAGQTAALDCLGTDLDSVLSTFLGEGNWRPLRKAMVERWREARKQRNQPSC